MGHDSGSLTKKSTELSIERQTSTDEEKCRKEYKCLYNISIWMLISRKKGNVGKPNTLVTYPLCDIPSGCCSFTGPWTVTRSSLRMLRRVATFCRPLRPVLLLVSFPRSRSPVVGACPPPPPPGTSYAKERNYYGPYAHRSLDKGVACAQHILLLAHTCMCACAWYECTLPSAHISNGMQTQESLGNMKISGSHPCWHKQ